MRVVIDTSAFITAILSSKKTYIHLILEKVLSGSLNSYISTTIAEEIINVINRDKIIRVLGNRSEDARIFTQMYLSKCKLVIPNIQVKLCRDPKDDVFLEVAESIKANYIISVDEDLLVLKEYKSAQIVRPYYFVEKSSLF